MKVKVDVIEYKDNIVQIRNVRKKDYIIIKKDYMLKQSNIESLKKYYQKQFKHKRIVVIDNSISRIDILKPTRKGVDTIYY